LLGSSNGSSSGSSSGCLQRCKLFHRFRLFQRWSLQRLQAVNKEHILARVSRREFLLFPHQCGLELTHFRFSGIGAAQVLQAECVRSGGLGALDLLEESVDGLFERILQQEYSRSTV
jgi:hypothetical protein